MFGGVEAPGCKSKGRGLWPVSRPFTQAYPFRGVCEASTGRQTKALLLDRYGQMAFAKIVPKKWEDFQHYKQRTPPWIKLHRHLLDDYEFHCLPVASKALAPLLWLLASEAEGGAIELNMERVSFRLRMTSAEFNEALKPLIDNGFFIMHGECKRFDSTPVGERKQDASNTPAECKPDAKPEKRRGETEGEKETEEEGRAKRASKKCPADFSITDDLRAWAATEAPSVDIESETKRFKDHTFNHTRTDWTGTWRNWMRRCQDLRGNSSPAPARPRIGAGTTDLSQQKFQSRRL